MAEVASSGCKVPDQNVSLVLIECSEHNYQVAFTASRLVYASRPWGTNNKTVTGAFLDAIKELNDRGELVCTVLRDDRTDPNWSFKRVFITCRKRSVLITESRFKGNDFADVAERIGEMP